MLINASQIQIHYRNSKNRTCPNIVPIRIIRREFLKCGCLYNICPVWQLNLQIFISGFFNKTTFRTIIWETNNIFFKTINYLSGSLKMCSVGRDKLVRRNIFHRASCRHGWTKPATPEKPNAVKTTIRGKMKGCLALGLGFCNVFLSIWNPLIIPFSEP